MPDANYPITVSFDGGNLDCGNGLLLLIRKHIDPLNTGELLEVLSSEPSVREDLPAWCRLTGNELVAERNFADRTSFVVCKGKHIAASATSSDAKLASAALHDGRRSMPLQQSVEPVFIPDSLPTPATDVPPIRPLSVMGIGSWPRPAWLLRSLHDFLQGRMSEEEFHQAADDSVRLIVAAQQRAGVDVVTDGEQRRDDYASFVGGRLDNCQLIPVTDLLPYVDHPEEFAESLNSLDVPAEKVRFPAVFGPLSRRNPMALHELQFAQGLTESPIKVALPGPYLLTRMMWMECISDRAYSDRESLAEDVIRILKEELHFLLAAGAAIVQFDEPVLTEAVYGRPSSGNRSFMCGALGNRGRGDEELAFAQTLINRVVAGLPRDRIALHICRGNWTPDESAALSGDYHPLISLLSHVNVGTLFLEMCTPRAGELAVLSQIPDSYRLGIGVVDQKSPRVEPVDELVDRGEKAIQLFGAERVLLNPDCGFATFADNPISP
ncbi:MAG: sulfurtransferase TusA family protein, partial [Planctomycetales bacterium]|nr:sulfurtransferase TusA family protein [Planctomycetales bacterium]